MYPREVPATLSPPGKKIFLTFGHSVQDHVDQAVGSRSSDAVTASEENKNKHSADPTHLLKSM